MVFDESDTDSCYYKSLREKKEEIRWEYRQVKRKAYIER
jgi:hypothetical protein